MSTNVYEIDNIGLENDNLIIQTKDQDIELTDEDVGKLPLSLQKIIRKIESLKPMLAKHKKEAVDMYNEIKTLEKLVERHSVKQLKQRDANETKIRKPSGFASPTHVSDELCDFMEKPHGTLISRTETSKFLTDYISKHKLQHPDNKSIIVPDQNLMNLLGKDIQNVSLTYFSIQKYITPHFRSMKK